MVIKVGPFEFPVKLQIEIIGKSVTVRSFFPGFGNKFFDVLHYFFIFPVFSSLVPKSENYAGSFLCCLG